MQNDTTDEKCGRSAYGKWLIQLREGKKPHFSPTNKYLYEAAEMNDSIYSIPELRRETPSMLNIFPDPSLPLVLDVGCYFGHTVVELAAINPGINVLGNDIKYKRVVKSARKITQDRLPNAKIAMCDILELVPLLPEQSLLAMFIFFPDPWVKNRHKKLRFIDEIFFNRIRGSLMDRGTVWLKTDHKEYYDELVDYTDRSSFTRTAQLPQEIAERPYATIFESIFKEQHQPIFQLRITPRN